jgi:diguanylate cyclase (GGDEF)-like protein
VVAGIPVVATVRILSSNALSNGRAHADAALQAQLQAADSRLQGLADNAASRAEDLSRSPAVQRALLTGDRSTLRRFATTTPNVAFYVHDQLAAGNVQMPALVRSASLALNGVPVGRVASWIRLDRRLSKKLLRAAPHARGDRLLIVRRGAVVGTGQRFRVVERTITLGGTSYRGRLLPIANAPGTTLLALRPTSSISAAVRPYQQRVMYAGIGSFGLLALVGLLFGGPILRTLGDFRRVASQASTDSLTGLANRWAFDEELALEWRRAERVGDQLSMVLFDIDDFKAVNDQHGHQIGDEVLRRVGRVIADNVRHVDLAARYGGEEFAVIVPETDLAGALGLAERLRTALASQQIQLPDGGVLSVTASFGTAVKGDLTSGEQLIAAADQALYDAKRTGKNRVAPELERRRKRTAAPRATERRRRPPASKKKPD